jgi:hypothetical protein
MRIPFSRAAGLRYGTFPYIGEDTEDDFLPLITCSGEFFSSAVRERVFTCTTLRIG